MNEEQLNVIRETFKEGMQPVWKIIGWMVVALTVFGGAVITNATRSVTNKTVNNLQGKQIDNLLNNTVSHNKFLYMAENIQILINRGRSLDEGNEKEWEEANEDFENLNRLIFEDKKVRSNE